MSLTRSLPFPVFPVPDPPAQHQSPRLLRPGDPPALGGRQPAALLQMLHHPMTLEPRPGKLRLQPRPWNSGGNTRTFEEKRSQCHLRGPVSRAGVPCSHPHTPL